MAEEKGSGCRRPGDAGQHATCLDHTGDGEGCGNAEARRRCTPRGQRMARRPDRTPSRSPVPGRGSMVWCARCDEERGGDHVAETEKAIGDDKASQCGAVVRPACVVRRNGAGASGIRRATASGAGEAQTAAGQPHGLPDCRASCSNNAIRTADIVMPLPTPAKCSAGRRLTLQHHRGGEHQYDGARAAADEAETRNGASCSPVPCRRW